MMAVSPILSSPLLPPVACTCVAIVRRSWLLVILFGAVLCWHMSSSISLRPTQQSLTHPRGIERHTHVVYAKLAGYTVVLFWALIGVVENGMLEKHRSSMDQKLWAVPLV